MQPCFTFTSQSISINSTVQLQLERSMRIIRISDHEKTLEIMRTKQEGTTLHSLVSQPYNGGERLSVWSIVPQQPDWCSPNYHLASFDGEETSLSTAASFHLLEMNPQSCWLLQVHNVIFFICSLASPPSFSGSI